MTNEEAIEIFEGIDELGGISMFYQMGAKVGSITVHGIKEAGKVAITALCAQQTPATLDRSRWEGCYTCNNIPGIMLGEITMCIGKRILTTESHEFKFCPECGRPLTEAAWAALERRINGGAAD